MSRRHGLLDASTLKWMPVYLTAGAAFLLVIVGLGQYEAYAQTDTVAAGMRIYRQKADCQACHGWAGDGEKMDSQMPDGANLRESTLDRERLIFVIKCGLPGRGMPAFDRRAYTDDRCLGRTKSDLDRMGLELFDPAATLQNREVERVADFLLEKIVGQGEMDRAKCIEYWGEDVSVCSEFPQ